MDCRDIFGQVTFEVKCRCFLCRFCLFTLLWVRLDHAKVQDLHCASLRFLFEWWRALRKFSWNFPGCRNGIGKNWDRAIAIISLQLTGQNVAVNTGVNSKAFWHSKCPVSYHRLSTLLDWWDFYPATPCSQGISEYPCRMTQGWANSHEQLMKTVAAVVLSPSLPFSHTSLSSVTTNASSSLFSGGEFTWALWDLNLAQTAARK